MIKNKIHYVETALSRQPNKLEMAEIQKLNPFVKLGVFNKEEDKVRFLQNNMREIVTMVSNYLPLYFPIRIFLYWILSKGEEPRIND